MNFIFTVSQVSSMLKYGDWSATSQGAVVLCGWEGNRRPGREKWQPITGWITYSHRLTACTLISAPGPMLGNELRSLYIFYVIESLAYQFFIIALFVVVCL